MDSTHSLQAWVGNVFSLGAIGAALLGFLPAIGAGIAIIWYAIQIYESATVQRWLGARRIRKLARLKARVIMMEAQDRRTPLDPNTPDDSGLPMR